jgi:hypothetical protein
MSVIVLVSILIMPIVYLLGLPHQTQELVASFGFGFGSIVTLFLLFMPKVTKQYRLTHIRSSAKVVAIEGVPALKDQVNCTPTPPEEMNETARRDRDAQQMLKHKTLDQKMRLCQEQVDRWQGLLMMQQRHALNSDHSTSNVDNSSASGDPSAKGPSSRGIVSSSRPVSIIEPGVMESMLESDPEEGPPGLPLFNAQGPARDPQIGKMASLINSNITMPTSSCGGGESTPNGTGKLQILEIQDV